jgi:hypothetical protein
VTSDLSIDVALNLDGGASTGLYMHAGNQHVSIDSLTQLPIVIIERPVKPPSFKRGIEGPTLWGVMGWGDCLTLYSAYTIQ